MLRPLGPGKLTLEGMRFLPPILSPLIDAAKRGEPLEPVVTAIVRMFGFDTFMYATSLSPRRGQEAVSYVFTTLPRQWVARYDQQAYIEIDPRVVCTFDSSLPFVWDQKSERGKSAAVDAYLDDAATHGVASGVSFVIYSPVGGHILVAFNSARPEIDEMRRFEIARNLGDMLLLGIYFHEVFMKTVRRARSAAEIPGGAPYPTGEAMPRTFGSWLHVPKDSRDPKDQRANRRAVFFAAARKTKRGKPPGGSGQGDRREDHQARTVERPVERDHRATNAVVAIEWPHAFVSGDQARAVIVPRTLLQGRCHNRGSNTYGTSSQADHVRISEMRYIDGIYVGDLTIGTPAKQLNPSGSACFRSRSGGRRPSA